MRLADYFASTTFRVLREIRHRRETKRGAGDVTSAPLWRFPVVSPHGGRAVRPGWLPFMAAAVRRRQ